MQNQFINEYLKENSPTQRQLYENLNLRCMQDVRDLQDDNKGILSKIQKIRVKYQSKTHIRKNKKKVKNEDFEFDNFKSFYEWFINQEKIQKNRCFYCDIEDYKLKDLIDKNILSTKRNRGKALEIERLDSTSNKYSSENCVLACYFCNNHKSDIISVEDHKKYFSVSIFTFLNEKWQSI